MGKVPVCFTEKESNELRRGRASVIKPIVEVRRLKLSNLDQPVLFIHGFKLAKLQPGLIILNSRKMFFSLKNFDEVEQFLDYS